MSEHATRTASADAEVARGGASPRPRRRGWLYAYTSLVQLALLFVVYVLSTGPMYWTLFEAFAFGEHPLLQKFYLPLVWLADRWPWLSGFLDWWIGLWIF